MSTEVPAPWAETHWFHPGVTYIIPGCSWSAGQKVRSICDGPGLDGDIWLIWRSRLADRTMSLLLPCFLAFQPTFVRFYAYPAEYGFDLSWEYSHGSWSRGWCIIVVGCSSRSLIKYFRVINCRILPSLTALEKEVQFASRKKDREKKINCQFVSESLGVFSSSRIDASD